MNEVAKALTPQDISAVVGVARGATGFRQAGRPRCHGHCRSTAVA
jgi:hypothetical protein